MEQATRLMSDSPAKTLMTSRAVYPPSDARRVHLVIVEDGARVSGSHLSPDECDDTIVVRQAQGELAVDLARRAIGRIATIERSGDRIGRALMLVSPRRDEQSEAARHLLARVLFVRARAYRELSSDLSV